MILLQERKALSWGDGYFSFRRLKLAGQNLKEGRFSCTVCADQAVAAALRELDIYIFKLRFFTDPQCYIICTDHAHYLLYFVMFLWLPLSCLPLL